MLTEDVLHPSVMILKRPRNGERFKLLHHRTVFMMTMTIQSAALRTSVATLSVELNCYDENHNETRLFRWEWA
jgi:hypothetical protein